MGLTSPGCPLPLEKKATPAPHPPGVVSGDLALFRLAVLPTFSARQFQWTESAMAAGGDDGTAETPEAVPPALASSLWPSCCSHLLPVSVSSPVGPPALLPLYFQWYIFYFAIQRKKWVVSIRGPGVRASFVSRTLREGKGVLQGKSH